MSILARIRAEMRARSAAPALCDDAGGSRDAGSEWAGDEDVCSECVGPILDTAQAPSLRMRISARSDVLPQIAYVSEFISPAEESSLLRSVRALPWTVLRSRSVQQHGRSLELSRPSTAFPACIAEVAELLCKCGVFQREAPPDHCLVNCYAPGQGIYPHTDGSRYEPLVATLSLGEHAMLTFRRLLSSGEVGALDAEVPVVQALLRPRSVRLAYIHSSSLLAATSLLCGPPRSLLLPGDRLRILPPAAHMA
jgi:alkylated DNA repair dioxygenase AlkB